MLTLILSFLRREVHLERPVAESSGAMAPRAAEESAGATSGEVTALSAVDRAMHRYADGEAAAFAEVHSALAPRLRQFLRRLGCTLDVAEDLTQETFLRMHHSRGSFARGKQVAPWAYAIARNCFISHARSSKTKLSRASVDAERVELPARGSSGEDESIARQSAEVVQRALLAMTAARREAFVLLRYEGMSVAAAAQIVGISEGALKIRAFHAYELLRGALAGMEGQAAPDARGSNRLAEET